jgi:hypothetical protein
VADLEAARGRTVECVGDGRLSVRTADGTRLIVVSPADPGRHADADEVVVRGEPAGPRAVGPDELHRRLCYAVDREEGRRLVRTHLDRDPEAFDPPGSDRDRPAETGGSRAVRLVAGVVLLAVAVGAAAALAVGAGGLPGLPGEAATDREPTPVQPVAVATAAPGRTTPVAAPERAIATDSAVDYPPGLSADGIADYGRLVRAHRRALAGDAYTVSVSYREFVNGRQTARYTERLTVANGTHYSSRTRQVGRFERPPMRVAGADEYADGSRLYVRTDDRVRVSPVRGSDPYLSTLDRYLGWHLSVNESAVESRADGYRVYVADDPYPTIDNATGVAVVSEDGLIRSLRRQYDRPYSPVRVELRIEVRRVDAATVERPAWVG